jgi:hypothetical protein
VVSGIGVSTPGSAQGHLSPLAPDQLLPQHAALIRGSAISDEVATARGYRSVTDKAELRSLGFSENQARVPALLLPVWDVSGKVALYQARPDDPRVPKGKPVKYETLVGSRMTIDVPPSIRHQLGDPSIPLWITEGIRKADAAVSAGLCCIGLLGVWNWRGRNEHGGKVALADWESIALNGRVVYIAFDSDVMTKREVAEALERLRAFVESRGGHVRLVHLPMGPDGEKVGLDDYLAAGHSVEQLIALVAEEVAAPEAADEAEASEPKDRRSQAARLLELAAGMELFRTPNSEPFATIEVGEHRETHPVRSSTLASWLRRLYWNAYREAVPGAPFKDAIETLAARAEFGGETHPVAIRVAAHEGRLYLDLANDAWQAIEIGPDGWRPVINPPVRFRRSNTMESLPVPVTGGSLDPLRSFINVAGDEPWQLFVGFLVAAFRASGPYLVLILHGEQGSAKSTTSRIVRALLDPSRTAIRTEPREEQDLLIAAQNNWVVAFDNVSHLNPWLSDALCRLSTGGGLGKRQLYTDSDEIVLDAQRPMVLNGITEIATRGDLLDRAIVLEQPTITDTARRSEDEFWRTFEAVRPQILGALLDAVAAAMANERHVVLERLPRMADPTRWVTAAEPALGWKPGTFIGAYAANRHEGHALTLEVSPISAPLTELASQGSWQGTSSQLLAKLAEIAGAEVTNGRDWPKNARALTEALKRLAPSLRAMGIDWQRPARTGSARLHVLQATRDGTVTTVTTVTANVDEGDGCASAEVWDRHHDERTVMTERAPNDGYDGNDGSDPGEFGDIDLAIEDDNPCSAWDPHAGEEPGGQSELWSFASGPEQNPGAAP